MLRFCAQLFNVPLQKAQSAGTAPIPSAMPVFLQPWQCWRWWLYSLDITTLQKSWRLVKRHSFWTRTHKYFYSIYVAPRSALWTQGHGHENLSCYNMGPFNSHCLKQKVFTLPNKKKNITPYLRCVSLVSSVSCCSLVVVDVVWWWILLHSRILCLPFASWRSLIAQINDMDCCHSFNHV